MNEAFWVFIASLLLITAGCGLMTGQFIKRSKILDKEIAEHKAKVKEYRERREALQKQIDELKNGPFVQ